MKLPKWLKPVTYKRGEAVPRHLGLCYYNFDSMTFVCALWPVNYIFKAAKFGDRKFACLRLSPTKLENYFWTFQSKFWDQGFEAGKRYGIQETMHKVRGFCERGDGEGLASFIELGKHL